MLKKIHTVATYTLCCLSLTMPFNCSALETGLASYYSNKFQGRKTSNGERYDKNKLTAAHRTLPIGSRVEVTNLKTKNSVIVTINDRGPYVRRLSIDLSLAAAKEIGLLQAGIAKVAITPVTLEKYTQPSKKSPGEELIEVAQLADSEEVAEAEEEVVSIVEPIAQSKSHSTKQAKKKH
jgi:rare lipoprotein A